MKKIGILLLVGILLFSNVQNVYAKLTSIDEVAKEFTKTKIISKLNAQGSALSSSVDTKNKKLIIKSEGVTVASFDYTEDYVLYDNKKFEMTKENYDEEVAKQAVRSFSVNGVIESILNVMGYTNITIGEGNGNLGKNGITYKEYGFEMELTSYEFVWDKEANQDNVKGEYVTYFKMSLDSERIKKLVEKFGEEQKDPDKDEDKFKNLIPTLEASDITENSITITPSIPEYTGDETPFCNIYRSTSEDGIYTLISDASVNCLNVGLVDKELESGTTYFYKAKVVGGSEFSKILSATTLNSKVIENENQPLKGADEIENPQTGGFIPIAIVGISSLIVATIYYYTRKKGTVYKI